jgi:hypothetical protein
MLGRSLVLVLTLSLPLAAHARPGRQSIWTWYDRTFGSGKGIQADTTTENEDSPFTIGTLAGMGWAIEPSHSYRLSQTTGTSGTELRVVYDRQADTMDRLQPGAFILPSVGFAGSKGNSWSLILPAGATAGRGGVNYSIGFGVSWGFAVKKGVELGVAAAAVWTSQQVLNAEQKASLDDKVAVPPDRAAIQTSLRPAAVLGLYMAPLF